MRKHKFNRLLKLVQKIKFASCPACESTTKPNVLWHSLSNAFSVQCIDCNWQTDKERSVRKAVRAWNNEPCWVFKPEEIT